MSENKCSCGKLISNKAKVCKSCRNITSNRNRANGKTISCETCQNKFYAFPYDIKNGRKYCSSKCANIGRAGKSMPKPPNFSETMRGVNPPLGRKYRKGYIMVFDPSHPNSRQAPPDFGYVLEHVRNMSIKIARAVNKGECIHHLNGEKDDNRIENLVLCQNTQAHNKIHDDMEKFTMSLIKQGVIGYDGRFFLR